MTSRGNDVRKTAIDSRHVSGALRDPGETARLDPRGATAQSSFQPTGRSSVHHSPSPATISILPAFCRFVKRSISSREAGIKFGRQQCSAGEESAVTLSRANGGICFPRHAYCCLLGPIETSSDSQLPPCPPNVTSDLQATPAIQIAPNTKSLTSNLV